MAMVYEMFAKSDEVWAHRDQRTTGEVPLPSISILYYTSDLYLELRRSRAARQPSESHGANLRKKGYGL